ncbi:MAG: hypothetical protein WC454_00405 [Phycisphaerae bacterium]|jgi:hypothetical protein
MENEIDVKSLISRPESPSTLVRFEDETDKHAPRLNYAVPLPNSYQGRLFLEVDMGKLPWTTEALQGENKIKDFLVPGITKGTLKDNILRDFNIIHKIGIYPISTNLKGSSVRAVRGPFVNPQTNPTDTPVSSSSSSSTPRMEYVEREKEGFLRFMDHEIPVHEIEQQAKQNRVLVIYQAFGGLIKHAYIPEAQDEKSASPRFVIIEHYRLSSLFGDYGAGRTVQTFSLWPGEETTLYVRNWRRTEQRFKQCSTIFDSYTQEAALAFETDLEAECGYREAHESTKEWKADGGASLNLGIVKIGGGGGGGGSSKSAREAFAKTVSKVSSHHSSKASAQRDTTISTELEASESMEFETITERRVKNVNLSRVLNIVCRELNQEFLTYLSLIDVSVAFVNDRHIYEEVPLYDIDRLLDKYLKSSWDGTPPPASDTNPRNHVKKYLLEQISTVFDFQGNKKQFIEEANDLPGGKYWRVRRRTHPDTPNPFYPGGNIPVEGVVLEVAKHTIRTDGIIVDALLGHGVALDNYVLGTQQEVLRERRLSNKKMELALDAVASGDNQKLEGFKSLFACSAEDVIKQIMDIMARSDKEA